MGRGELINFEESEKTAIFIKKWVEELKNRNVEASLEEVRVKLHNFTCRYRKEKAAVGPSGISPTDWPLYGDVHAVIGTFKINNADIPVEESIRVQTDDDDSIDSSSPISVSTDEVVSLVDDDGPLKRMLAEKKKTETYCATKTDYSTSRKN